MRSCRRVARSREATRVKAKRRARVRIDDGRRVQACTFLTRPWQREKKTNLEETLVRMQDQVQTLLRLHEGAGDQTTLGKATMKELWESNFACAWRGQCARCDRSVTPLNVHVVVRALFNAYYQLYSPKNVLLCCSRCAKFDKLHMRTLRWDNKRALVWLMSCDARYESACYVCRSTGVRYFDSTWHMAHVLAAAKGGVSEPQNLRVVCADCNAAMRTQSMQAFMRGRNLSARKLRMSLREADNLIRGLRQVF